MVQYLMVFVWEPPVKAVSWPVISDRMSSRALNIRFKGLGFTNPNKQQPAQLLPRVLLLHGGDSYYLLFMY